MTTWRTGTQVPTFPLPDINAPGRPLPTPQLGIWRPVENPIIQYTPAQIGLEPTFHDFTQGITREFYIGSNLVNAGTAAAASGNEVSTNIQVNVPLTGSVERYQKNAFRSEIWTSDDSTDGKLRDSVGGYFNGAITGTAAHGRAWGIYTRSYVKAGADGHAVAIEASIVNEGSDQVLPGSTLDKIGVHIPAELGNGTTAVYINANPTLYWHKGLLAWSDVIGTGGSDAFIDLYDRTGAAPNFRVRASGATTIDLSRGTESALTITGNNTAIGLNLTNTASNGARFKMTGNGGTTPSKTWRVQNGAQQLLNDAGNAVIWQVNDTGIVTLAGSAGNPQLIVGAGSPETVVTAVVGSVFFRTNGGAATTFYVKESGVSNTGWVGK